MQLKVFNQQLIIRIVFEFLRKPVQRIIEPFKVFLSLMMSQMFSIIREHILLLQEGRKQLRLTLLSRVPVCMKQTA